MNQKLYNIIYTEYEDQTKLLYTEFGNLRLKRHMLDDNKSMVVVELWNEDATSFREIMSFTEDTISVYNKDMTYKGVKK